MPTTTDTLAPLDTAPDNLLNELFAVAYTDWKQVPLVRGDKAAGAVARFERPTVKRPGAQAYTPTHRRFKSGSFGGDPLPMAATSADVVLPYLERFAAANVEYVAAAKTTGYRVDLFSNLDDHVPAGYGLASTFARAVVIALLRAHKPAE